MYTYMKIHINILEIGDVGVYVHVYVHTYIYTYMYMYIYIKIHINTFEHVMFAYSCFCFTVGCARRGQVM